MGLESFSTGNTTSTSRSTKQSNNQKQQQTEDDEPFKTVTGDRGRKKVFPTEEDWNETVEFIEQQMGMTVGEVLNMKAGDRYQILHQAILKKNGSEATPFHPTKECIVCGKQFVFPKTWNFVRVQGEVSCPDHKIDKVMEEVGAVNALKKYTWD